MDGFSITCACGNYGSHSSSNAKDQPSQSISMRKRKRQDFVWKFISTSFSWQRYGICVQGKTHKQKQIWGIVQGLRGWQKGSICLFGSFLMGEEKQKQNSPENPGTIPCDNSVYVFCCSLVFFAPKCDQRETSWYLSVLPWQLLYNILT